MSADFADISCHLPPREYIRMLIELYRNYLMCDMLLIPFLANYCGTLKSFINWKMNTQKDEPNYFNHFKGVDASNKFSVDCYVILFICTCKRHWNKKFSPKDECGLSDMKMSQSKTSNIFLGTLLVFFRI